MRLCHFRRLSVILLASACTLSVGTGVASAQTLPVPHNVVQLSAAGTVEVAQDFLTLTLSTTREAQDAAAVQSQLKAAVDAALAEARRSVVAGQLDVRSGSFSLYPRTGQNGKITTWQGTAEIVLEGRDFARLSETAGRVTTLSVRQVAFSLSREQRAQVETQAQAMAIERFKSKAGEIARGFGFADYSLREVSVSADEGGYVPAPRVMAMQAKSASAELSPVPVEAGKSTVQVTVSGAVQLK